MPDAADTARWRIGGPVRVGALTLWAVERVTVLAGQEHGVGWVWAALDPIGVIWRDGSGLHVLGLGDEPLSLAALQAQIPGVDDALAGR